MSPIYGLSERVQLPRLGKIRLGIKAVSEKTGNPYPVATDYFVCPPEVQAVYGETPRELEIMFPLEDETKFASQWLKCYSNLRGLICKGDARNATALVDTKTGEIASREAKETELREIACDPDKCVRFDKKQCRQLMCLQFLLPAVQGFGVWQLDTTSYHSIVAINSGIKLIRSVCGGRISMIPLSLQLGPLEVSPEGTKKTVHVLKLTAKYSLLEMVKYAQLPPGQALLPEPLTEPPEDLYPEEVIDDKAEKDLRKDFVVAGGKPAETPPAHETASDPEKRRGPGRPSKVKEELAKMGARPVETPESVHPSVQQALKEREAAIKAEQGKMAVPVATPPTWKSLGFQDSKEQGEIRRQIYEYYLKFMPLEITKFGGVEKKTPRASDMNAFCPLSTVTMTRDELLLLLKKAEAAVCLYDIMLSKDPDGLHEPIYNGKSLVELSFDEINKLVDDNLKAPEDLAF